MEWQLLVEMKRGAGDDRPIVGKAINKLVDALDAYGAAIDNDDDHWSVTMSAAGATPIAASVLGLRIVCDAALKAGLPIWPNSRLEVRDYEEVDAEQKITNFPDVVGAGEALEILGISKQRLHQLRAAENFPRPMVELMSGPVWIRSAIESFKTRVRPAGRPARAS